MLKQPLSTKHYLWLALFIAFLLAIWAQGPRLLDPLAIEEDFRTLYWVHRYQQPDLFPNAPFDKMGIRDVQLGSVTLVIESNSPGYSLLFQTASYFMPIELFHKLLVFPLLLISVFYIYHIGLTLSDAKSAFVLSLLFAVLILAAHTSISVVGGLHRSFGIPIILALIYYLSQKQYGRAAIPLWLCGLIYLPLFPVCLLTYGLYCLDWRQAANYRLVLHWQQVGYLSLAFLAAALPLLPAFFSQTDRVQEAVMDTLPTTSYDVSFIESLPILQNPHYSAGGRQILFELFPLVGRGGISTDGLDGLHLLFLTVAGLLIWWWRRPDHYPLSPVFVKLFCASLIGYSLAWIGLLATNVFVLYLPSRHTQTTFFIIAVTFVGINLSQTVTLLAKAMMRERQKLIWVSLPVVLAVLALTVFLPLGVNESGDPAFGRGTSTRILLAVLSMVLLVLTAIVYLKKSRASASDSNRVNAEGNGVGRWQNQVFLVGCLLLVALPYIRLVETKFYVPSSEELIMYDYLKTLPTDAFISGEPCSLDSVPYYGQRAILFSCERFFNDEPITIIETFLAYYAESSDEVGAFCRQYGVDYLIVNLDAYEETYIVNGSYFFEPYTSWLTPQIKSRTHFVLANIPEEVRLFQIDGLFVVPCELEIIRLGQKES